MTTSVFIWSITDMRKDNMPKKLFNLTHLGIKIIAVLMFVVYLRVYLVSKLFTYERLLSFAPIVFLIVFLLYNNLLVNFHKKGGYTSKQAVEFYEKCREQNISDFQKENFEKAGDIYFSVFGTDKYLGDGTILNHMEEIYNAGKEITEKQ